MILSNLCDCHYFGYVNSVCTTTICHLNLFNCEIQNRLVVLSQTNIDINNLIWYHHKFINHLREWNPNIPFRMLAKQLELINMYNKTKMHEINWSLIFSI